MVCPFCLHGDTQVYNSRQAKKTNAVWRRRRCVQCHKEFTTRETIDATTVLRVNNDKKTIPFSPPKLLLSLIKALDHRPLNGKEVQYLFEIIEQRLIAKAAHNLALHPKDIAQETAQVLKRYDAAAYVKYLSYHNAALDAASLRRELKRT